VKFLLFILFPALIEAGTFSLQIKSNIDPNSGYIQAETDVVFPEAIDEKIFYLNSFLEIKKVDGARIEPIENNVSSKEDYKKENIKRAYRLIPDKGRKKFHFSYSGQINFGFRQNAQDYARSFSESDGIISSSGVYLSASSFFYPYFENNSFSFKAAISIPKDFSCITSGIRLIKKDGFEVWQEEMPVDELTISCGKFKEYSLKDGERNYYAFLLNEDKELADRYLETTQKYVNFYSSLLGEYPYKKFALVENFWETGYGLPSFTLLGSKVIRLPFIISSSYPHEILHNWWGNGVFVDYSSGNWCEGLTVYLADYLIKDNKGKGREYRRDILKKYRDYVIKKNDFPIRDFVSRHSSAQEAVGYGKAMMFYHMLRNKLTDEVFLNGLRDFYKTNLGEKASFDDLRKSFEKVSGLDLKTFFNQWIDRIGTLKLSLENVLLNYESGLYKVSFQLKQKDSSNYSNLDIPVVFYFNKGIEKKMLSMSSLEGSWEFSFRDKPLAIAIDPDFELFREISPLETPPALSGLLGEKNPYIVLPCNSKDSSFYSSLADSWNMDEENKPIIVNDCSISSAPQKASWYFGFENKFHPLLHEYLKQYGASLNEKYFFDGKENVDISSATMVFSFYDQIDPSRTVAYILSNSPQSMSKIARKLPHYGKYSWLIFDENGNILKTGIWEKEVSPLKVEFSDITLPLNTKSNPLSEIPSFLSKEKLKFHVEKLSKEIKGRFPGSQGFERAHSYIVAYLKEIGVKPFYSDYDQYFTFSIGSEEIKTSNIIAAVPGKSRKDEYVVLSAHYDHLKSEGEVYYPGANDNASGTALLLELADYYARNPAERTIIFAFFSAEEEGRIGSKYFLSDIGEKAVKINANLNFDEIGALRGRKILVLNSYSSDKWVHILRGAGFVTQNDYELSRMDLDSSDQVSFIEKNIPAIQFFDGGNGDYHKPSDTSEKIDYKGIVSVGEMAREVIAYLASDSNFISRPLSKSNSGQYKSSSRRKVSTGLMPDFSYQGNGVKAQEIAIGSPLEKAGLVPGDVIVAINDVKTPDLKSYSETLKTFNPGDKIKISYISLGKEKVVEITLDSVKY